LNRAEASWTGGLGSPPGVGDVIGPYRVLELIGTGGMASVFRAAHDGSDVALKVLNPARVLPEDVRRFTREFRSLSRMDHEHIVRVFEAGVHEGYPWISMELVDGTDLEAEISRWKRDPPEDRWERVTRILTGLCKGLAYIHDLGLVHRDLKPSNILVTRDGTPKISDFGVVKSEDNSHATDLTAGGRLVGTVAFMAPELITDEPIDGRADLYALGAVLYLMGTLRRPIEAESVAGYLARHLTEVPRPLGELEPSAPPILERIAARLLQKDRTYRYPTAQAVLQALERPDNQDGPPVRGRDAIQSRWTEVLLGLQQNGVGGAIGFVGPMGSGRSHLLRALADQARSHGIEVAFVAGTSSDPLETLSLALGVPSGRFEELAERIGSTPAVIAVDDLDRAPSKVIDSLARMLRQRVALDVRPVLVAFTAADAEGNLAAVVHGESTGIPCEILAIGPVGAHAVLAMLRDRRLVGPVAPVLARRLHQECGGMPGPIVQQLDALVDEHWLGNAGDRLDARRPIEEFRRGELPVPTGARRRIVTTTGSLDPEQRDVCELLAVLDRPASTGLLERCRPHDSDTPRVLDALVRLGIMSRTAVDAREVVTLVDPYTARVLRSELSPERRRDIHHAIGKALAARRRRSSGEEVAFHLRMAGDHAGAYPLYVQAARRVARDGRFAEVIDLCSVADELRAAGEAELAPVPAAHLRRWLYLLRGEALLARRGWDEAVAPLSEALAAARIEGDPGAMARCLVSLGRAHYRAGRFAVAEPLLRESLTIALPDAPERTGALRALADIALRLGRLDEAERLWTEALAVSLDTGNKDVEARSRRGLAHLRAIQGDLDAASELLAESDQLLGPEGDYRVRAGVLARAVELDTAAGRLASAAYRADILIELARRHGMCERLPEAYALLAELRLRVGDHEGAHAATQQNVVFTRATAGIGWEPRLRAARALAELGHRAEAIAALPAEEEVPSSAVDDPPAQLAAVRAQLIAEDDPLRARDLAGWAMSRPPPLLSLAGARVALDSARALLRAGSTGAARNAVKHGLARLGSGGDGLRLELLVVMQEVAPDPRVTDALGALAARAVPQLPPGTHDSFAARPVIRDIVA